jgi:hypothetical protein
VWVGIQSKKLLKATVMGFASWNPPDSHDERSRIIPSWPYRKRRKATI